MKEISLTQKMVALVDDEDYDANRDLIALALANIGSALSGAFVVNGSPTKTEIVDEAGSRTQWATLVTAVVAVATLFILRTPLAYLPEAVLAAVVFTIGVHLIRLRELQSIRHRRQDEWVVALATAAVVVIFGVEIGIVLAMAIALINHVRRGYDPSNYLMHYDDHGAWVASPVDQHLAITPGVYLYRFQASLYYANVEKFSREVRELAQLPRTRAIIVDASAIADVDYSAGLEVIAVVRRLADAGIELVLTHTVDHVRQQFDTFGISAAANVSYEIHTKSALLRYSIS
jgi:MFS superfamily sulfate permease-like transporter